MKTNTVKTQKEGTIKSSGGFSSNLGAPANRALVNAGFTRLEQLALVREDEVKKLHGIGPHALKLLRAALNEAGLNFKSG